MSITAPLPEELNPAHGPFSREVIVRNIGSPVGSLLQGLWRYKGFLLAWMIVLMVPAVYLITHLEPRYTASALVALDTRQIRFTEVSSSDSSQAPQIDPNFLRTEVEILTSDALARQVVEDLHLDTNPKFMPHRPFVLRLLALLPHNEQRPVTARENFEATVAAYRRNLSITHDEHSYVINVTFQAVDPALAAQIANRHIEVYIERQRQIKDRALATATSWLNLEVDTLAGRLKEAERAVQTYREEHKLFVVNGTSMIEKQLEQIGAELGRIRIDIGTRQARAQQAGGGTGLLAELEIAHLRETDLEHAVSDLEGQLASTERSQDELHALERQATAVRSLYETLLARQKQISTQIGIQQPDAQVISPAIEPLNPSFPNKPLFLAIVSIVVLASGCGIAVLLEFRRPSVTNLEEAEATTGFPVLAAVPKLKSRELCLPDQVASRPRSPSAEAIRSLRSALAFQAGGIPRTLAVTSALPGEGKTSVTLSLARSLAASGLQVLLIDCDLRRGRLAKLAFGRAVEQGAAAVLAGRVSLSHAVRADRVSCLHILASELSVTAPQDLLDLSCLQRVLTTARAKYDYVIIDTPPLGAVSDALLIARAVDGMLLVLRADSTPTSAVTAAVKMLCMSDVRIPGVVLNFADAKQVAPSGYQLHPGVRSYSRS
jgi:capsular exopolysaccharide synthesis family protein